MNLHELIHHFGGKLPGPQSGHHLGSTNRADFFMGEMFSRNWSLGPQRPRFLGVEPSKNKVLFQPKQGSSKGSRYDVFLLPKKITCVLLHINWSIDWDVQPLVTVGDQDLWHVWLGRIPRKPAPAAGTRWGSIPVYTMYLEPFDDPCFGWNFGLVLRGVDLLGIYKYCIPRPLNPFKKRAVHLVRTRSKHFGGLQTSPKL